MPTLSFGLYPAEQTEATQVSSTYEGRYVTMYASELMCNAVSGTAIKGYPVVFGQTALSSPNAVGIAMTSGTGTDLISVDTEGIWNVEVHGIDDNAVTIIYPGEDLYINTTTCVVSRIRNNVTQIPFGYALGQVGSNETDVIAVKVHWDPNSHWLLDNEMLYFGDGVATPDVSLEWTGTLLEMLPLTDHSAFNIGNGTLSMDVQIFGADATEFMLWNSTNSTLDIVDTVPEVDDTLCITSEDTGTHTGSGNGIHVGYTKMSGAITGAGAISAINGDVQARANCTHVYAFKGYAGIADTPTLGYLTGYYVYCDNLGGATVAHYQCADLNIDSTVMATAGNTFIRCGSHGAAAFSVLYFPLATGITNLLFFEQNVAPLSAGTDNTNVTLRIACHVGAFGAGTTHYLRLFSD